MQVELNSTTLADMFKPSTLVEMANDLAEALNTDGPYSLDCIEEERLYNTIRQAITEMMGESFCILHVNRLSG